MLKMTSSPSTSLWIGLVAVASVALSLKLQCVLPFAALAAVGVLNMRRNEALALVGLAWVINQALGYTVLGYPHDADSYSWGAMIGVGSVAAVLSGEMMRDVMGRQTFALKAAAVLVTAFAVYEAVLFAATAVLPATDVAFSARIVAEYGLVNAIAFVVLLGVHSVLTQMGLLNAQAQ